MFGVLKRGRRQLQARAGLDIGAQDLKLVEITEGEGKPIVTAIGRRTPVTMSREEIVTAIKVLAANTKLTAKEVAIAVSGQSVIVRFITMPKMSREELAGAIRFEAEKHIPFNINECVIDFQVLREYPKENKADVLLAAAKKEFVDSRVKMVIDAGLAVRAVDIDGFAMANTFLRNYPQAPATEKTVLLLDTGASLTNLAILKGSSLCLVRDVAIGGKDLNAALARGFGLDPKNVDDVQKHALANPQEVLTHIRPVLAGLMDEVRLSCSYYENQCGRAIDEIYVSGGACRIGGLLEHFQEAFGIKPNEILPFQAFDTVNVDPEELKKAQTSYVVAVGLALR